METDRYYKVTAKCGHVRRSNFFKGSFYVTAENGKAAAAKTRGIPRVKHDHKDAIMDVEEISREEYETGRAENEECPYYLCTSGWEQKLCFDEIWENIFPEPTSDEDEDERYEEKGSKRRYKRERNLPAYIYEAYFDDIEEDAA